MKLLLAGLQGHLDSGNSTMCYCWRVKRADGTTQGFTEHDRNLTFNGQTYLARAGFTSSQLSQKLGLSVDNLDIQGGLNDDTISEDDLASGLYDNAEVEIWWVNWQDTNQRILQSKGFFGEVVRGRTGFEVEFRSLSQKLQQKNGRIYTKYDDGSKTNQNLAASNYTGTGTIVSGTGRKFIVSGLSAYSSRWFDSGLLTFTSGANNGAEYEVKVFNNTDTEQTVEMWFVPANPVATSDTFTITVTTAGDLDTYIEKFGAAADFRGFPYMPGNDALTRYPIVGEGADGQSLFK